MRAMNVVDFNTKACLLLCGAVDRHHKVFNTCCA